MAKLPEIWKTAGGNGAGIKDRSTVLLTDADLDLDSGEFGPDDPDLPDFVRDRLRERQHDRQVAADADQHQRQNAATGKDQNDSNGRFREWLASQQYRHAMQELSSDVSDARTVAREAYTRAYEREREAEQALEDARRHALVLADGRRVYFTRDGRQLFSEDGEITDATSMAEAERLRKQQPDATTYEDFVGRWKAHDDARNEVDQLQTALDKLDEIDAKIKRGNLSPEELAQAQRETKQVIEALPPEAREAYEQRKAVREKPEEEYRSAADLYTDAAAFRTAVDASEHFSDAHAGKPAQSPTTTSQPGAKPVSVDTDDYRQGF